ncbi:S26 family signal peptidase [Streptomyces antioxidans]|uniref:Signal peptidase I n=1 Tax=Streptomyces antioxidans TaxID=1507734 RepID=A0A1V4CX20_9ACTN|nr:signal peptidase I [Streptomyces antioxidans]OPF72690.1 S26 family signal peptidase [Streptomyces antioxidans]
MSGAQGAGGGKPRRTPGSVLSGLAVAVGCVLFLGGFVWGAVLYKPYTVPTDSMDPTIGKGARVLAERVDGGDVRRGDVVVFRDQVWGDLPMVKRVIGVGGDRVECCDKQGRLRVNGKDLEEPYLRSGEQASASAFSTTVPKNRLFLLGDHRSDSLDSRVHLTDEAGGAVERGAVDARVDATAWPLGSWGTVGRPAAFKELPGGISQPGPLGPIMIAVIVGAVLILAGAAYGPIARRRAGGGARRDQTTKGKVAANG